MNMTALIIAALAVGLTAALAALNPEAAAHVMHAPTWARIFWYRYRTRRLSKHLARHLNGEDQAP